MVPIRAHVGHVALAHRYCWSHRPHHLFRNKGNFWASKKMTTLAGSRKQMKKTSKRKQAEHIHPDHSSEIIRVRRIIGQLEGVEKMIIDRRYCPQILQQVKAATSAMNALKMEILKKHLSECLSESARSGNYSKLIEQVLEIVQTQIKAK